MKITINIGLAKEVLQIHGEDANGKKLLRTQLKRKDMAQFLA